MFPKDIAQIAVFAIKNSEWKTADLLIDELYGWMDDYDLTTGIAADRISRAIMEVTSEKGKDVAELQNQNKFLKKAVFLTLYAKNSGVYNTASR